MTYNFSFFLLLSPKKNMIIELTENVVDSSYLESVNLWKEGFETSDMLNKSNFLLV